MKRTCILSVLAVFGVFSSNGVRLAQARGKRVDTSATGEYQVVLSTHSAGPSLGFVADSPRAFFTTM